jgi:OFA family oxalate/formate antiporter-like MFS transporter
MVAPRPARVAAGDADLERLDVLRCSTREEGTPMSSAAVLRRSLDRHGSLSRLAQVVAGVVGMMAIAGVVFVWPLLRSSSGRGLAESLAATQNAFALFIIAETIFVPLEGWLGDRFPRWLLVVLGVGLVFFGAFAGVRAESVRAQVACSGVGGVGAGLVYGGTVAKALKRFTDRKAVAVGLTAAACVGVLVLALGAITALSLPTATPLLIVLGAGQAAVILLATLFILYPPTDAPPPDW